MMRPFKRWLSGSIVEVVEARCGSAGRWRWYGLDRGGQVRAHGGVVGWNTPEAALKAAGECFPLAEPRVLERLAE